MMCALDSPLRSKMGFSKSYHPAPTLSSELERRANDLKCLPISIGLTKMLTFLLIFAMLITDVAYSVKISPKTAQINVCLTPHNMQPAFAPVNAEIESVT